MGFRRIVAFPVLGGLLAMTGLVALAATTLADPAPETPAVGGKLLDPETIQILVGPAATPMIVPPPTTVPAPTPSDTGSPGVTEPTPPAAPDTEPEATTTTPSPQPPNLVTSLLEQLGIPTTPCEGAQCDETNVECTGDSPICFQGYP